MVLTFEDDINLIIEDFYFAWISSNKYLLYDTHVFFKNNSKFIRTRHDGIDIRRIVCSGPIGYRLIAPDRIGVSRKGSRRLLRYRKVQPGDLFILIILIC
ncbi:hypothetical protein D3C79_1024240 [compost metagenome]